MRFLSYLATVVVTLLTFGCAALTTLMDNGERLVVGAFLGLLMVFAPVPIVAISLALAGAAGALVSILMEPHTTLKGPVGHAISVATSLVWVAGIAFLLLWVFGHHVNPLRIFGWLRRAVLAVKRAAGGTERK